MITHKPWERRRLAGKHPFSRPLLIVFQCFLPQNVLSQNRFRSQTQSSRVFVIKPNPHKA
jgi:hypothetical protein